MDAITLLKNDHKTVEDLFKRYEACGDRAYVTKREIVDRIIEELSRHTAIEEQLFYPVARATVPETEGIALESLEEHHIVKWLLHELNELEPADERFDAKVTVLMENVRHHVSEEEGDFFPLVRDELGRKALGDLGETMSAFKNHAPTHPHPKGPDTPPGNLVIGAATGAFDWLVDSVNGVAQGAAHAAADLMARVTGSERPKVSPTGSTVSRKAARNLRTDVSDLTDSAIAAVKAAQQRVEDTAEAAKTAGEKTAQAAKSGAKRTASTARAGVKRTAQAARS